MPFSNAPTIDTFNRADENPIASPWANLDTNNLTQMQIASNAAKGLGTQQSAYHVNTFTDAAQEFWIKLGTVPSIGGTYAAVACRIQQPGGAATWDGYMLEVQIDFIGLYVVTNGIETVMTSSTATIGTGDVVGIRCIGDRIDAWKDPGGILLTTFDSTVPRGGYGGVITAGPVATIDEFGGGTYSVPGEATLMSTVSMGVGR